MENKIRKRFLLVCIIIILITIVSKELTSVKDFVIDKIHSKTLSSITSQDFPSGLSYEKYERPDYDNLSIIKVVDGLALDSNGHVWEKHENAQGLFPVWKKNGSLLSDIIDIESIFGETFYAISKDHTAWAWGSDEMGTVPISKELRKNKIIDYPEKIVNRKGEIIKGIKKIAASYAIYLLKEDGTVYAFGSNDSEHQLLGFSADWTADESYYEELPELKTRLMSIIYSGKIDYIPYPEEMNGITDIKDIFVSKTPNNISSYFIKNDGTILINGMDKNFCTFTDFLPAKEKNMNNSNVSVALLDDGTAVSWYSYQGGDIENDYMFVGHKKDESVEKPYRIKNNQNKKIIQCINSITGYEDGFMFIKNGQLWRQGSGPQDNGTDWIKVQAANSIELDLKFDSKEDVSLDRVFDAEISRKSKEKSKQVLPYLFHQKYADGTPVDDTREIFSYGSTLYFINNEGILYAWGVAKWLIEGAEDNIKDCYFPGKVTFHPYYDKEKGEWISFTQE